MNKITKLICFSLLCFSAINLPAANYYIDSKNGSDSNSGRSKNTPWRTIEILSDKLYKIQPGDSVLLRRGGIWSPRSFDQAVLTIPSGIVHGTELLPIVFGAYGKGGKPVISAANTHNKNAFYAGDISHVIIQDIEFRGNVWFYTARFNMEGIHHIKLLRLTIDGTETGGYLDFWADASELLPDKWKQAPMNNIEIAYSVIRNVSGSGIQMYGSGNNHIHHNEIYNAAKSGINFAEGDSNIIEYNIISGTGGPGIKHSAHSHSADNIIIRGNLILNSGESGMALYNLTGSYIYNNTVHTNGIETAIFGWTTQIPILSCNAGKTGFDNNKILNNIFYGGPFYLWNAYNVSLIYNSKTKVKYEQPDIWEDNIFQNNIIFNPFDSKQIYVRNFSETEDLIYPAYGSFESGDSLWVPYDSNEVILCRKDLFKGKQSLKITCRDYSGGAYLYLNPFTVLAGELKSGQSYIVSVNAKSDSANAKIVVSGGGMEPVYSDVLTGEWENYQIKFTAGHHENHFIRCSVMKRGESVWLNNLSIYENDNLRGKKKLLHGGLRQKYYSDSLSFFDYYIRSEQFNKYWLSKANINGDLSTDPLFINAEWYSAEEFGDYCLRENSPAKRYGVVIAGYNYDLLGNPVPDSEKPDIGAIQSPCYFLEGDTGMVNDYGAKELSKENPDNTVSNNNDLHFLLNQNYPNPFNPETNISFVLPKKSRVIISIYNILGERVDVPVNTVKERGSYNINWKSGKLTNGIYIIVFYAFPVDKSSVYKTYKKMVLLN